MPVKRPSSAARRRIQCQQRFAAVARQGAADVGTPSLRPYYPASTQCCARPPSIRIRCALTNDVKDAQGRVDENEGYERF